MRAVRAALAALPALLTGFLACALGFVAFFVFVVLDEADPAGFGEVDCPATGSTAKRKASAQASRGIEVGEVINLMLSL
jgi:hypothetical protein